MLRTIVVAALAFFAAWAAASAAEPLPNCHRVKGAQRVTSPAPGYRTPSGEFFEDRNGWGRRVNAVREAALYECRGQGGERFTLIEPESEQGGLGALLRRLISGRQ